MSTMLDALKGRTIVGIDVSEGEDALRFRFTDEFDPIIWQVDGDCCSHSYWHDGYSLNALRGGTVVAAAGLDLPDPEDQLDEDGRPGECIQAYGYSIVTDKGAATLAFRNSSNGYYGGYASLGTDRPSRRWRELTANDWQAGSKNDPPTRTPEELAAERFRREVEVGLRECNAQLREVVPSLAYVSTGPLLEIVEGLQETKTTDILVLGVYLTRMAEESLKAQSQAAATNSEA